MGLWDRVKKRDIVVSGNFIDLYYSYNETKMHFNHNLQKQNCKFNSYLTNYVLQHLNSLKISPTTRKYFANSWNTATLPTNRALFTFPALSTQTHKFIQWVYIIYVYIYMLFCIRMNVILFSSLTARKVGKLISVVPQDCRLNIYYVLQAHGRHSFVYSVHIYIYVK